VTADLHTELTRNPRGGLTAAVEDGSGNQHSLEGNQMKQNAGMGGGSRLPVPGRGRRWRTGALAAVAGVALLVAGCGGSNGTGSTASTSGPATYAQMAAYSQCMQSHGAPAFPNPAKGPGGAYGYPMDPQNSSQLTGPGYNAALKACKKLQPRGGGLTPAERQAAINALLRFARCMRTHGLPDFPDPTTNGRGIQINFPVDPSSPQFQSALKACRAVGPPGLQGGGGGK
jgi:hypothetical protein